MKKKISAVGLFGRGRKNGRKESGPWFKRPVSIRTILALILVVALAVSGLFWMRYHRSEEVEQLEVLANQGDAAAQYQLGVCFAMGKGVARDPDKAVYWYRRAAHRHFPEAQFALGDCLMRREGRYRDEARALNLWREAARQGNLDARNALRERGLTWEDGQ